MNKRLSIILSCDLFDGLMLKHCYKMKFKKEGEMLMNNEDEKKEIQYICLDIEKCFLQEWYKLIIVVLRKQDDLLTRYYYQRKENGLYYLATPDDFDYLKICLASPEELAVWCPFDICLLHHEPWNQLIVEFKHDHTLHYQFICDVEIEMQTFHHRLMCFEKQYFGGLVDHMTNNYGDDNEIMMNLNMEKMKKACVRRICALIEDSFLGEWHKFIIVILRKRYGGYEMVQLYYQRQAHGPYALAFLDDFNNEITGWTNETFTLDCPLDTHELRHGNWNRFIITMKYNQTFEYQYIYDQDIENQMYHNYFKNLENQYFGKLANYMRISYCQDDIAISSQPVTMMSDDKQWEREYNLQRSRYNVHLLFRELANEFNHMLDQWHQIVLGVFYDEIDSATYQIKIFYQISLHDNYQELTDQKAVINQLKEIIENLKLEYDLINQSWISMTYILKENGDLRVHYTYDLIHDMSEFIKSWQKENRIEYKETD